MFDGNGDLFGNTDDVGKLQADETDVVAFDNVIDPFQFVHVVGSGHVGSSRNCRLLIANCQ
jgi:hypothetical protein